jgi:hypothetical protein
MPPELTAEAIAPFARGHVSDQTSQHLGQWVALFDGQVIASGKSLNETFAAADRLGMSEALIFKVPSRPGMPVLL